MRIEVKAVNYQRNGVSGDGFYTVRFRSPETEREYANGVIDGEFLAVMPGVYASDDPEIRKHACECECYVVYLPEPELCWRGDCFAPGVIAAIRAHQSAENAKWERKFATPESKS